MFTSLVLATNIWELSGFKHAAFSLRAEAQLDAFNAFEKNVPYGELISLLGKAMLYNEAEKHYVGKDEMITNCTSPFYLMEEHVCNVDPKLKPSATLGSAIEKRKAAEAVDHKDVGKIPKLEQPSPADGTSFHTFTRRQLTNGVP